MSWLTIVNNPSGDFKLFVELLSTCLLFCFFLSKEIQLNNCIQTVTMVELPPIGRNNCEHTHFLNGI